LWGHGKVESVGQPRADRGAPGSKPIKEEAREVFEFALEQVTQDQARAKQAGDRDAEADCQLSGTIGRGFISRACSSHPRTRSAKSIPTWRNPKKLGWIRGCPARHAPGSSLRMRHFATGQFGNLSRVAQWPGFAEVDSTAGDPISG